jgi:hypothetical protein
MREKPSKFISLDRHLRVKFGATFLGTLTAEKKMGRVHFIGDEKGGVGKSLVARVLAQYFIDHERPFFGFDLDQSHATFPRFYRDYTVRCSSEA